MTGITIRDASNRVMLDMTMKISQRLGNVDTNSADGSFNIPESVPAGKQLYFVVVPLVDLQVDKGKKPGVTLSGTSLTWSYSFYSGGGWGYFAANCRIYYGYF